MIMTNVRVQLFRGLQATNTTAFVHRALAYSSTITIEKQGRAADGKNIMALMDLYVQENDHVRLFTHGDDEALAHTRLRSFLQGDELENHRHMDLEG